jgi:hypothetical protein
MTEHFPDQGSPSDGLPYSALNLDDAHFADSTHWEDIRADVPTEPEVLSLESEYSQTKAKITIPIQKRDRNGNFYLHTTDDEGHIISLGHYLASDLFKKASQGKITHDELKELLTLGNTINAEYHKYGPRRHASDEYDVVPADDELDWRDNQEKAAGEQR